MKECEQVLELFGGEGPGFAVFFFLVVLGEDTAQAFRPAIVKVSSTISDSKKGGGIEFPVSIVFVEDPDIFQVRDGVIGGLVASGTVTDLSNDHWLHTNLRRLVRSIKII